MHAAMLRALLEDRDRDGLLFSMTAVFLSHFCGLGYGWFLVDALVVMLLAII